MPANEFEKQVQQKMDEFRLEPSASVWQKVEEEIRKKKRRRIVFFFILPAAIALMALSVYYFTNSNPKNEIVQEQIISGEKKSASADEDKIQEEQQKNNNIRPQTTVEETDLSKIRTKTAPKNSINAGKTNEEAASTRPVITHRKNIAATEAPVKNNVRKIEQDNSLVIDNNIPEKQTIVRPGIDEANKTDKKISESEATMEMNNNKKDVAAEQKNIAEPKPDSIEAGDVTKNEEPKEAIAKKKAGKSKIKWGIDFSAGLSGSNENIFSLDFQKSLSDAVYANPGSSTGGGQRTILAPSSVNSGFSFKTGIVAELQVSKKSRLLTGLQYAYSSSRISTSRRQDSVVYLYNNNYVTAQVNGYYRSVQQIKYTNRFHFIQVPLSYQWQFNKGKKLPLQWTAGLSFGYMVATNGLVYDTSYGGIYFHDKQAFSKFHINAGTGIALRLKGKKGSEWVFGPELWFDLKKLTNNPLDKKQYLMYGGIRAGFLLPQKKK